MVSALTGDSAVNLGPFSLKACAFKESGPFLFKDVRFFKENALMENCSLKNRFCFKERTSLKRPVVRSARGPHWVLEAGLDVALIP